MYTIIAPGIVNIIFFIPASPSNPFFVTAIKDWNALSSNIKNTSNFLLYKKLVKSHLSTKATKAKFKEI